MGGLDWLRENINPYFSAYTTIALCLLVKFYDSN